ncbi:hypothetical protein Btru_073203 [Bulinus truncatus]|nr:hypothetical protein Btru_073203 [Bulinus truncatus]
MLRCKIFLEKCPPNWTLDMRAFCRSMSNVSQTTTEPTEVRPFEDIPGPKGIYQWPLIGSLLHYKPFSGFSSETLHELIDHMHETYGPVFKMRLGATSVLICDPKDIETVYRHEGRYPIRPGFDLLDAYNKRQNVKANIGQLQGTEWHAVRTPVNKRLMKADSATHYLEQQNEVADDFVKILETQKIPPQNLKDLFLRYASESIAVVTFNKRLGLFDPQPDQDSVDFLKATEISLNMITRAVAGHSIAHRWFRNSTYRRFETAQNLIRRVSLGHISQARKSMDNEMKAGEFNEDEPNLLFSLLSEKNLTLEDVSDIMTSLYSAGTDSTAKYSQVFLYNLAKNPEKQTILRNEILSIIGRNGPLTAKALSQMVYLKATLKESFRLNYPTPIANTRILPVNVTLGGFNVPAGVPIFLFNQRPARLNFENPYEFLPERWLRSEENTKKDSAHSMIVLPFGHGPRNCIGRRFAVQEIYLAAVKVLQRLTIDTVPESAPMKFMYKPFIEAQRPIQFKFKKID